MMRQRVSSRRAVAAVELALVTTGILIPLLFGVWEIGRMIQVRQILSNSAREGARLASQGFTINSSGSTVQVYVSSSSAGYVAGSPTLVDTVYLYLSSMGLKRLQKSDVTVNFAFTAPGASNGTMPPDPYLGDKGQPFYVKVTIPWTVVRWVNAGIINPANISYTVNWVMLRDDAFTVNTQLPSW